MLICLLTTGAWGARAADCAADGLEPGPRVTIQAVAVDGTLREVGGREIRLAGINLPRAAFGHDPAEPLAEEARRALETLTIGQTLVTYVLPKRRDRYDRLLAHPCLEDGRWVQASLLAEGLAMVATTRDTTLLAAEMLALEKAARSAKAGIWNERVFRVRNPYETRRDIDTYQIVEGRVVSAVVIKGRAYLNFGQDWRTDFTFSIAPRDRRRFERQGIDLASLGARRVRGRGWVTLRNGPLIELTHPEQLEILPE
jgi:micrococcal nuclease